MSQNCLETKNHEGKEVVFTEEQRLVKSQKHSVLRDPDFINGRLRKTVESPDFIYEDLGRKNRHALYGHEYTVNGRPIFTKVVVNMVSNPIFIVTAYRPDYVKERGKTKLIYGNDI